MLFGLLHGQNAQKWAQNGLQMGLFHAFVHPKWSGMRLKNAFWTHF